jgi:hypothetical protein
MKDQNIILLIFAILILLLFCLFFHLYFQNKKESFEGIAGTSFVSRVPKGTIVAYYPPDGNPTSIPAGWVLCDGQATLQGTTKVPDLRGRFIRMASTGLTEMSNEKGYAFDNVNVSNNDTKIFSGVSKSNNVSSVIGLYKFGEKGGSDKIKLDEAAQLPPHTHGISGIDDCGSNCPNTWNLNRGYANSTQTKSTGSSEYVPNVPPFYTLVYIIKL